MTQPPVAAPVRVHVARAVAAEVPAGDGWLTAAERAVAASLHVPRRRADWRLGRWVAKQAVIACAAAQGMRAAPSDVEVLAGPGGAPAAHIASQTGPLAVRVSLSHRDGIGVAAASLDDLALGCDAERVEPRSGAFVSDYFTAAERTAIGAAAPVDRAAVVMLAWSAKEAALKALGEGLRLDTRAVEVQAGLRGARADGGRIPLSVRGPAGRVFTGWAWLDAERVTTLVADRQVEVVPAPSA